MRITPCTLWLLLLFACFQGCGDDGATVTTDVILTKPDMVSNPSDGMDTPPTMPDVLDTLTPTLDPEVQNTLPDIDETLYFVEERPFPNFRVHALSLSSGTLTTVFDVPEDGFVTGVAVSPDQTQLAMTYIPPPTMTGGDYNTVGLFVLDLTTPDATPTELLWPDQGITLGLPVWAPDGQSIYVVRLEVVLPDAFLTLQRYDMVTGHVEDIDTDATSPVPFADGERLAYVKVDREADSDGLVIRHADGTIETLIAPGDMHSIENLRFDPSGAWLHYTSVRGEDDKRNTKHGQEHTNASDAWRVPVAGGEPEQVTPLGLAIYSVAASTTDTWFHFSTPEGIFSVRVDPETGETEAINLVQSLSIRAMSL